MVYLINSNQPPCLPLTPLQELGYVLLSPERGIIAFIIQADEHVQQSLDAETLAIRLDRTIQEHFLQLFQTNFPRHGGTKNVVVPGLYTI